MQYKAGSVTVTNGSQIVTGLNTLWAGEITAGDLFIVVDTGVVYQVGSVDSNTQITLNANYAGASESGAAYVIARDFTPIRNIPLINRGDIETATIFTRAMQIIDGLL